MCINDIINNIININESNNINIINENKCVMIMCIIILMCNNNNINNMYNNNVK